MGERKLATVDTIHNLRPIAGADLIEVGTVRGWDVVVGKGQFSDGDTIIYTEADAALPVADPLFANLAPRGVTTLGDGTQVHVLKTARLRGQLSQGLVLPVGRFEGSPVGTDVTADLGITLFEPVLPAARNIVGPFLSQYASKSDAERVQNLTQSEWAAFTADTVIPSEKLDGSSVTFVVDRDGNRRVCTRNWEVILEGDLADAADAAGVWNHLQPGWAVTGELFGEGIQSNRLRLNGKRWLGFTLFIDGTPLPIHDVDQLPQVPGLDLAVPATPSEAVALANGLRSALNPQVLAEGMVWHNVRTGQKVKAINNAYLLKHGL